MKFLTTLERDEDGVWVAECPWRRAMKFFDNNPPIRQLFYGNWPMPFEPYQPSRSLFMKISLTKVSISMLSAGAMLPSAFAETVYLEENFDSSAAPDQLDSRWTAHRGTHPGSWAVRETDPDGTTANRSIWIDGGSIERTLDDSSVPLLVAPSNDAPMVFSFDFYDFGTPTGDDRLGEPLVYGELQSSGVTPLFAAGIASKSWFGSGSDPATFDATRYQARIFPTAPGSSLNNWFQLKTLRGVGWRNFKFVVRPDSFDVYVDDVLDTGDIVWRTSPTAPPNFTKIRMGGGFSQAGTPALFDNVLLSNDPSLARALTIIEHPKGASKHFGESVTFSGDALGSGEVFFKWHKNGNPLTDDDRISGSDSYQMIISGLTPDDRGNYTFVVTDDDNSTPSSAASLYVTEQNEFIANGASFDGVIVEGLWSVNETAGWYGYRHVSMTSDPGAERTVTFPVEITESGYYDIYTWFVPSAAGGNRPTEAPYHIFHADGDEWVFMNQQLPNGNKWELVRKAVRLEVDGDNKVVISNLIQEGRSGGGALMADAIRWVKVDPPVVSVPPTVAISRQAGNAMVLSILGAPTTTYSVEASPDLLRWDPLGDSVTTNAEGAASFMDPDGNGGPPQRFYRVSEETSD